MHHPSYYCLVFFFLAKRFCCWIFPSVASKSWSKDHCHLSMPLSPAALISEPGNWFSVPIQLYIFNMGYVAVLLWSTDVWELEIASRGSRTISLGDRLLYFLDILVHLGVKIINVDWPPFLPAPLPKALDHSIYCYRNIPPDEAWYQNYQSLCRMHLIATRIMHSRFSSRGYEECFGNNTYFPQLGKII